MIEELPGGHREPGVHRWTAGRAEADRAIAAAERAGLRVFRLDGRGARDKASLLARCAVAFALPDWFGHNWDALQDCLTDLSWAPASAGRLVVYEGWTDLAGADPAAHETLIDVFRDAVAYWRGTPTPLWVLLFGE